MKRMLATALFALAVPLVATAQTSTRINSVGHGQNIFVDQSAAIASSVDIEQIGNSNQLVHSQIGTGQSAAYRVSGNDNAIAARQEGNGANSLSGQITGNGNEARLTQFAALGGSVNALTLIQHGSSNFADLSQSANAGVNQMALTQNGHGNSALLTQNGDDNSLSLTQNGNGNHAQLSQTGNGLGLALTQNGDASIAITQVAP